jgi:hypothetical protein
LDLNNGRYAVDFVPVQTGAFSLDMMALKAEVTAHIAGSPYVGIVLPGPANANMSLVMITGMTELVDGPEEPCTLCDGSVTRSVAAGGSFGLRVILSDIVGNLITIDAFNLPPPSVAVNYDCIDCDFNSPCECANRQLSHQSFARVSATDVVAYNAIFTTSGHYQVAVLLRDYELRGQGCATPQIVAVLNTGSSAGAGCERWMSPVTFRVDAGPIDASKCTASGEGLSNYVLDGQFFTGKGFEIRATDRFGNSRRASDSSAFSVVARMQSETPVVGTVAAGSAPGLYIATYAQAAAGNCEIHVTVGGVNVIGSPFHVTIGPGEAYAGTSEVSGNSLFYALKDARASAVVSMKDWYRNLRMREFENVRADEEAGLVRPALLLCVRLPGARCVPRCAQLRQGHLPGSGRAVHAVPPGDGHEQRTISLHARSP